MSSSAKSVTRVAEMRAKRGARWLDENFPGWEKRIKLGTLELSDGQHCICGQVFKKYVNEKWGTGYGYASEHLFAEANSWISAIVGTGLNAWDRSEAVSVALGFSDGKVREPWMAVRRPLRYKSDKVEVTYSDLQTAWVKLLKERKAVTRA